MAKIDVISKGRYTRPKNDIAVEVDSYVLARENGEKFILLKLRNKKDIELSGVVLTVTQFGKDGKILKTEEEEVAVCAKGGKFVLSEKIKADPACADFAVDINAAEYGNYRYTCSGGRVVLDYNDGDFAYDPAAERKKMGGEKIILRGRKFRFSAIVCLFAVLIMVCAALFTIYQLNYFTEDTDGFISDGIKYNFSYSDTGERVGVIIEGYSGRTSQVVIPSAIEGTDVIAIGEEAFKNNTTIKEISIDCDVEISNDAFYGCSNLKSVTCNNILSVGDFAFYGCSSLRSISLSDGTESIGRYAFAGCSSLTSLDIPDSVASIGYAAFEECDSLISLTLPSLDKYLTYYFGSTSASSVEVPSSLKSVIITSGTSLPVYAFYGCSHLTSVTWESETMSIGNYAFYQSGVKNVDFSGVTAVGNYAFAESAVTKADMGSVMTIGEAAFSDCSKLTYVSIPSGVGTVSKRAFADCTALKTLVISDGVTKIGEYAFSGCSALTSLTLPKTVTSIGGAAFEGCNKLKSLTLPVLNDFLSYYFGSNNAVNVSVPSSLTSVTITSGASVPNYAFYGCSNLLSVTFSGAVSVGDYAFYGCSSLTLFSFALPVTYVGDYAFYSSGITQIDLTGTSYIGAYAFVNCGITLVDTAGSGGLTGIGEGAFRYCSSLAEVYLPSGLSEVNNYAFADCSALASIEIPQSVTSVGYAVFYNCSSLKSLTMPAFSSYLSYYFGGSSYYSNYVPSSLTEVNITGGSSVTSYAFYDCKYIKTITLPSTVKSVGQYAFLGCTALTSLVIPGGVTAIGYSAFNNCSNLRSLTLPSLNTYISYYFGSSSYRNAGLPSSLTEVNITGGTSVADYAFYGCEYVETVTLGGDIAEIGQYAFYGCTSLENFELPSGVEYIGNYAFTNCGALASVDCPYSLTHIGSYAFYNCSSLGTVILRNYVTIDDYAFYGCSSLYVVYDLGGMGIEAGSENYGYVGYYALSVNTASASVGLVYADDFVFLYSDGAWRLVL